MEAARVRRWRVPYEWILGSAFVASFALSWANSFVARAAWLAVVGLMAGIAWGVRRKPGDPRPRAGLLLFVAATPFRGFDVEHLLRTWPCPALLGFVALGLAAMKPGRYRESAVLANASFLLVLAWIVDLSLSSKNC